MLINTSLEAAVLEHLDSDPRILDSTEIAVSVESNVVVLRGTVESLSQRRAAGQVAHTVALRRTHGAYEVDNQLKVNLPRAARREDDELRGVALQALVWDTEVPSDTVEVKVDDGWVTLKGEVTYQFQSDAAYEDVASLSGVYGITNEIKVDNAMNAEPARR